MSSKPQHEMMDVAALRERLRHVYWIGGGSGAGKSTIGRRIAAEHGFRVYPTDEVMSDHARRSTPEDSPLLHQFMAMSMDERWVNRSPETMLETFPWFRGECFNLIVEDLLNLPAKSISTPLRSQSSEILRRERGEILPLQHGVIVEGFRLLPHLVQPMLSVTAHAVWLLPTPAFRETVIEKRGGLSWGFLARTSDPETALRNLLERDRQFTDILREETARLQLQWINVDDTTTEHDLTQRVTSVFGLSHFNGTEPYAL